MIRYESPQHFHVLVCSFLYAGFVSDFYTYNVYGFRAILRH
jgi:hypothetical protein